MSIFAIACIALLIALLILAGMFGIYDENCYGEPSGWVFISFVLISFILWGVFTVIGIGISTECDRIWVAKYEAQKYTIEASIDSDVLSGLERIQLVEKATELNGELARRKAEFNLWHYATFDRTIYDNVELIQIK